MLKEAKSIFWLKHFTRYEVLVDVIGKTIFIQ